MFLTMDGSATRARRHAVRRRDLAVRRTIEAAVEPLPPRRSRTAHHDAQAARGTWLEIGGAALLILALHAAFMALAGHRYETRQVPLVPPKPMPMTVELTHPPVPLPQAKRAPRPPIRQPLKQQLPPRPLTRAPMPKPAPAVTQLATTPQAATPAESVVARTTAPIARAPVALPTPVLEAEPIGNAAYLHNPAPDYPPIALDQGWEGHVLLRVHVLANGRPDSVDIKTSSGRRMLDDAALATVRRWSFVPAKRGDEAVDGWVNVPIDFKLG